MANAPDQAGGEDPAGGGREEEPAPERVEDLAGDLHGSRVPFHALDDEDGRQEPGSQKRILVELELELELELRTYLNLFELTNLT